MTTSGGKSIISNNGAQIGASAWLKKSFESFGYRVEGFNRAAYKKNIRIFKKNTLIKEFTLIGLIAPSKSANISSQGMINRYNLNPIIDEIKSINITFNNLSPVLCYRIIMWSYFLYTINCPIRKELKSIIEKNHNLLNKIYL